MYIYIIKACKCTCSRTHTHAYMLVHEHENVHVHMYTNQHAQNIFTRETPNTWQGRQETPDRFCIYTCIYMFTYTHTYTLTCTHTHSLTHVDIYIYYTYIYVYPRRPRVLARAPSEAAKLSFPKKVLPLQKTRCTHVSWGYPLQLETGVVCTHIHTYIHAYMHANTHICLNIHTCVQTNKTPFVKHRSRTAARSIMGFVAWGMT